MRPWLEHWRDWVMNELWPMSRRGPRAQGLHFGYEKAGLVVHGQPIPWNAEAVLVEALLRLPPSCSRRKGDYFLRLPGCEPVCAEQLRRQEEGDRYRVQFRIEPPGREVTAELLYRRHVRGQITLPYLDRETFIRGLGLQMPTLFVRLGTESVACQTFVSSQCKGLLASAVITSPTSLVSLLDLDLQVEFRCERSGATIRAPARLCATQLAGRQALVTVAPRRHPRRLGDWTAAWLLADRVLVRSRVRGISQAQFQRSLRVSDTRFVVQTEAGAVFLARQVPPLDSVRRLGPCFLLASGEAGVAGQCQLQITAQVPGAVRPPVLWEQEVLLTDGPTTVAPGTLDTADLAQVTGFELRVKGKAVGVLSLCPAPTATFTGEGGFSGAGEYTWSAAAEEEMNERLNRLLRGPDAPGG
jgi:hypothetical protein